MDDYGRCLQAKSSVTSVPDGVQEVSGQRTQAHGVALRDGLCRANVLEVLVQDKGEFRYSKVHPVVQMGSKTQWSK